MKFIKNGKGEKELLFEGYVYQRCKTNHRRTTPEVEPLWVCAHSEECKGFVTTDMEYKKILSYKVHCHEPKYTAFRRTSSLPNLEAQIEFIPNNKGGKKLIHDGYMYTKKYDMLSAIKWECSRRSFLKCGGTVTTELVSNKIIRCHVHNHPSSNHAIEAAKAKIELKKAAWLTRGTNSLPRDVVKSTFSKISTEAQKEVGKADSNRRLVRRYRRSGVPVKVELETERLTINRLEETVVKQWEKFEAKWAKFEENRKITTTRHKPY